MWKTKRLLISPLSAEALEKRMTETVDAELKRAFGKMLDGVLAHPNEALFYTDFEILRRDTKEHVGDACFMGSPRHGAVEIGYGILPAHQGQGYMTEALEFLVKWAFSQEDVYTVEAETAPDNEASLRVLLKCGFMATGKDGEEGPRFAVQKPVRNHAVLFMLFGLAIGNAFNPLLPFHVGGTVGLALGFALGLLLHKVEAKHRAKVTEKDR